MYRYETHCHTKPVSACGRATVKETVEFYKELGYDGLFLTNHFLDGNIGIAWNVPVKDKLDFYFSDYEEALKIGERLKIKVFLGIEMSYGGTDFLVYGLEPKWWYDNQDIFNEKKSRQLPYMMKEGALIVHAHPFREADYIDHIRLYPREIDAVEVVNAERTAFENRMADMYADSYGFLKTAGSDNHIGRNAKRLAGVEAEKPIVSEKDFIQKLKNKELRIFTVER